MVSAAVWILSVDVYLMCLCFLVDPKIWFDVISCVHLAGQLVIVHPSVRLVWQRLKCWTSSIKFSVKFFHACHACGHHYLLLFYISFSDLDLDWGLQGRHKANMWASFTSMLSNWMGWIMWDDEAIQVEDPDITLDWDLRNEGKWLLFYWLYKKI